MTSGHLRILLAVALVATGLAGTPAHASGAPAGTQLTVTDRLADRRTVVTGDRFYEVGAADGRYPATGWHIRGEMGGFWTPPIKLLDGLWFAVDGHWLTATSFTSGYGYTAMDLGNGVRRVDVVPDGVRAGLVGLRFDGRRPRVTLTVDAHSELLKAYPWGWTTPPQDTVDLPDTGGFDGRSLLFQETPHHYAALVGSDLTPDAHLLGPGFRGPQDPPVRCPASNPAPAYCDDGPFGRGTGGQLTYTVDVPRGGRTVWFAVAGSDQGTGPAYADLAKALRDPAGALAAKQGAPRGGRPHPRRPARRPAARAQRRVVQAEPRRRRAGSP